MGTWREAAERAVAQASLHRQIAGVGRDRLNGASHLASGFRSRSTQATNRPMVNFMSHFAVPIAIGAVAVVLLLGLANMMRGGSGNTSQKLMRWRVVLQFIAIIVIMLTVWIMQK